MAFALASFLKGLLIRNEIDTTKQFAIQVSPSATTNTSTTLIANQTADRVISLPDVTDTLSTASATETLTNKTIDGDNNTILNIDPASFKPIPGDANNFLVRDGSGNVVSNTKAVPTGTVVGTTDSQVLTNKTIDADLNTLSNIENADIKAAAAIAVNKLAALTASRAVATDGSGFLSPSATTSAELAFVSGVTSSIQTQLDSKPTRSGSLTDNHVVRADGTSNIQDSAVVIDDLANITGVASLTFNTGGSAVGTTATQTLTNKTFGDSITAAQIATPTNPSAGFDKLYFKSDNILYSLTSAGVETPIGAASLTNPMTTQGDLIVGGTSGTPARLAGAAIDNQVLLYDTGTGNNVKWGYQAGEQRTVTTNVGISSSDEIVFANNSANATVALTLPAIGTVPTGKTYSFYKTDWQTSNLNIVSLSAFPSFFHYGGTSTSAIQLRTIGESFEVVSTGALWRVTSHITNTQPTVSTTYTPTITGWGAGPHTSQLTSHREGGFLVIQGLVIPGTPTAASVFTMTMGFNGENNPSTAISIDTNVYQSTQNYVVGTWASQTATGPLFLRPGTSTTLIYAGVGNIVSPGANGNALASGGAFCSFNARIKIANWIS